MTDGTKLVNFNCPKELLKQVDTKIERDGIYTDRTDLLLSMLRKYVQLPNQKVIE